MRAVRPRSPSETTTALMWEGRRGSTETILRAVEKAREQVRRDAAAILGRGADIVDWRDLVHERALRLHYRRAASERRFGAPRAHHRRRDAAERNPHLVADDTGHDHFGNRLRGAG